MALKDIGNWVVARVKEPSTRTGAAGVLLGLAQYTPYPYSWAMIGVAIALGGHVMITKDKLPPDLQKVLAALPPDVLNRIGIK